MNNYTLSRIENNQVLNMYCGSLEQCNEQIQINLDKGTLKTTDIQNEYLIVENGKILKLLDFFEGCKLRLYMNLTNKDYIRVVNLCLNNANVSTRQAMQEFFDDCPKPKDPNKVWQAWLDTKETFRNAIEQEKRETAERIEKQKQDAIAAKEQARIKREKELEKSLQEFKEGKLISGVDIIEILEKNGFSVHIRTKGMIYKREIFYSRKQASGFTKGVAKESLFGILNTFIKFIDAGTIDKAVKVELSQAEKLKKEISKLKTKALKAYRLCDKMEINKKIKELSAELCAIE